MDFVPKLVAALVKAANSRAPLSDVQTQLLLNRALRAISDLFETITDENARQAAKGIIKAQLEAAKLGMEATSAADRQKALLVNAKMLMETRITLVECGKV